MSRVFIENLPKNINENELRKRFEQKGEITDIQLKKDKRNAFIGFKLSDQANDAVEYFNKTFINSSKISVKIAQAFRIKKSELNEKDDTQNSSQNAKEKFDPFKEIEDDPDFQSFLQVQRNIDLGKGKQIWKDDVPDIEEKKTFETTEEIDDDIETEEYQNKDEITNSKLPDNLYEFTVKIKGLPYKIKKRQLKDFFKPIKPLSLRLVPHVKGIAYMSFKNEKDLNDALVKHRGFIDGHRVEITKYKTKSVSDQEIKSTNNSNNNQAKWKNSISPAEPIGESGRIYIRNLCYTCTEDDLRQLFEKYGVLTELYMPIDYYTKKPKGFAFVTFMFPEHAVKAFNELDKTDFQGRLIHLLPAHAKEEKFNGPPLSEDGASEQSNSNGSKMSDFKKSKQAEIKNEANNSINWNTLFIRPNAVADIMTKKFNVSKIDLLTKSTKKDNVAVRMALGETQIVNEVRQFLTKHNVCLDSFERGDDCVRSKTVILVKNLPAETEKQEVSQLFEKFGLVNQVILPPYGITAIVEMQEPNEAKFAFKKLAYTNFKHHPLYLEWAPENVFDKNSDSLPEKTNDSGTTNHNDVSESLIEENSTIFVKNLNFKTAEESFRNHFNKIGPIHSTTIATKKSPEGLLSTGYGFIQYYTSKDAKEAVRRLQNSVLDEHTLEIKLSNRSINKPSTKKVAAKPFKENRQTGSKICVKNIPFEATVNDIQKLFSVYGQIKFVRLPKKLTGTSSFRGFGFVDFVSKEDAKRAFDALSHSTHLYGRPLVLEWAKEDSNVESFENNEVRQIGAKTARYFVASESGSSGKKLKKTDLVNELEKSSFQNTGDKIDDDD